MMAPTDWGCITTNSKVQLVFSVVCKGKDDEGPHMVQSRDTRGIKIWIWGCLPEGDLIGAVDLQVTSEHPVHLQVVSTSYLYAIPTCAREHLFEVVDLCCGLGGSHTYCPG